MKRSLCVSTVVNRGYHHYIPLFIYCLKKNYPEYHVKIFVHGDVESEIFDALKMLPYNFDLIPNVFAGYTNGKYNVISWRFVVPPEHYEGFDYVYITDIDMMILKEDVSLLNFHLNEMGETGLCYSNSLRNKHHWKGGESLTGLHFVSQQWFEKTEKSRVSFAELLRTGRVGERREYDGNMLWLMCQDSGLELPKKHKLAKRHHGIHLGNFRLFTKPKKLCKRMDTQKCQQWLKIAADPLYQRIYGLITKNTTVRDQLEQLELHCRSMI